MKSRSMKSAVYAAGVVFAPSEDVPNTSALPRVKPRTKRRPHDTVSPYEARFVDAKPANTASSVWWRAFDFSWLIGRATA